MANIEARTLMSRELNTNLGFICAKTAALYHMATATIINNCIISKNPVPLIKISIAAIEPKQLEAMIPKAALA